jgi:ElaA protein
MLIEKSLPIIKEHFGEDLIALNSQSHAIGFYERFGFKTVSEEFFEAGVPHVKMELKL